jgi:hypothetical protein
MPDEPCDNTAPASAEHQELGTKDVRQSPKLEILQVVRIVMSHDPIDSPRIASRRSEKDASNSESATNHERAS